MSNYATPCAYARRIHINAIAWIVGGLLMVIVAASLFLIPLATPPPAPVVDDKYNSSGTSNNGIDWFAVGSVLRFDGVWLYGAPPDGYSPTNEIAWFQYPMWPNPILVQRWRSPYHGAEDCWVMVQTREFKD